MMPPLRIKKGRVLRRVISTPENLSSAKITRLNRKIISKEGNSMHIGFWAVGNRAYPEKIYKNPDGSLMIYDNEEDAKASAEKAKTNKKLPAVIFEVGIEQDPHP